MKQAAENRKTWPEIPDSSKWSSNMNVEHPSKPRRESLKYQIPVSGVQTSRHDRIRRSARSLKYQIPVSGVQTIKVDEVLVRKTTS